MTDSAFDLQPQEQDFTDPTPKAPSLGQAVGYVSAKGATKLAFVLGNADTIHTHSDTVPSIQDPSFVHLMVFSPTGKRYVRYNVGPSVAAGQTGVYLALVVPAVV